MISTPIQNFFWKLSGGISNFFSGILKQSELKKENENLKIENQNLLREIALLKELENENKILREALEIGLNKEYKLIFANIIGRETDPDFFRIDKGEKDGIANDMAIITQSKILCGKVIEVSKRSSRAILPTKKNFLFTVKIAGFDKIFPAKGGGDSTIFLEMIPKDLEIKTGDLILTSAEGGFFPKDLLVGKIENIEKSDLEPFQKAKANLICQISEIDSLFVIKEW